MFFILIKGLLLFFLCQCVHIMVWRLKKPTTYGVWVPTLLIIFVLLGGLGAAWLATLVIPGDNFVIPYWLEWSAIFLFQLVLSAVYIIGYTAVAAFSPSMELIKVLDRTPEGLTREQLETPFFQQGALSDSRIDNLVSAELIQENNGYLYLARRGRPLTSLVLFYRHMIGLPDGEGG